MEIPTLYWTLINLRTVMSFYMISISGLVNTQHKMNTVLLPTRR